MTITITISSVQDALTDAGRECQLMSRRLLRLPHAPGAEFVLLGGGGIRFDSADGTFVRVESHSHAIDLATEAERLEVELTRRETETIFDSERFTR